MLKGFFLFFFTIINLRKQKDDMKKQFRKQKTQVTEMLLKDYYSRNKNSNLNESMKRYTKKLREEKYESSK